MSTKKIPPAELGELAAELPAEPTPAPAPERLVSVREWGEARIAATGYEIVAAFVRLYGRESARPSELERDFAAFCSRPA